MIRVRGVEVVHIRDINSYTVRSHLQSFHTDFSKQKPRLSAIQDARIATELMFEPTKTILTGSCGGGSCQNASRFFRIRNLDILLISRLYITPKCLSLCTTASITCKKIKYRPSEVFLKPNNNIICRFDA